MANKVQLNRYYVQIVADSNDAGLLRLLSTLSGIEATRSKDTYRCSLHKLPEVLYILRGVENSEQLCGITKQLYDEEMLRRTKTAELKRLGPDLQDDSLWEHQRLGVDLARVNRRYNFYYDTRTGKTRMAFRIMLDALKEGRAKRCLVVAPSAIIPDWLKDAKEFPELKVQAYYKDAATKSAALQQPSHIIIWSLGMFADSIDMLKAIKFDICFFDESSKLKNYSSKTSKAALALSGTIPSWYNLSATPAPNGEHEYYTQMRIIDPYSFSPAHTRFELKYFDDMSTNKNYKKLRIKQNMREELMQIVEESSIYVDQKVMPMAGKEWHAVEYCMSDSTAAFYKSMASDMYADVEGVTIAADQAVAMRAKLNQITSGFLLDTEAINKNKLVRKLGIKPTDQVVYQLPEQERVKLLDTLLNSIEAADTGSAVVIWANYAAEFNMLRQLLGDKAAYVRGGTNTLEREAAIAAFRAKRIKYLVAHPLSIGMGINLTVAHHAIYYSLSDSWEALKQSSERICGHVDVQPHKCYYWVIIAEGTVNRLIYDNVENKRDASAGFMEHLKAVALR